jgi:hypothetical protein
MHQAPLSVQVWLGGLHIYLQDFRAEIVEAVL